MRLLWTKYLPASNKPAPPRAPRVASPLKSILFVGIIVYLLFYPAFREIPGLGRLAPPGRANEILLAYTAQWRYAASSQRSSYSISCRAS
jgi:hypothetical protein